VLKVLLLETLAKEMIALAVWNTPVNFPVPTTFGGCLTYTGVAAELDKMKFISNLISVKAMHHPTNQLT
jgi:hypothetical protein